MSDEFDPRDLPPSKSMRKREAHAVQKLGEELIALREDVLARLPLPEGLREALDEARRLTHRGALSRQRQYIGKLMREVDVDAIRDALTDLTDERNARARLRK